MSSRLDNLALAWIDLKDGVDRIYEQKMNKKDYMILFTNVHNYCTFVDPSVRSGSGREQAEGSGTSKLIGLELYKKLREYLKQRVTSLRAEGENLMGEELLSFFEKSWRSFRFSSNVLDGAFRYLNRNWVKREFEEGRKSIVVVYALALMIWRDIMLKPFSQALISAIFREIEKERHGETVATQRLQAIIECLVELRVTTEQYPSQNMQMPGPLQQGLLTQQPRSPLSGQIDAGPPGLQHPGPLLPPSPNPLDPYSGSECKGGLTIYQDHFERPFLLETKRFYMLESTQLLQTSSVMDYLKRVEVRLKEERNRVQTYLHISTQVGLLKTCEQSLIGDHMDRLIAEFPNLLQEERMDDIARMYRLVGRFPEGKDRLVEMTEKHVEERGSSALRQVCQTAVNNPKLFVDTIIQVQKKNLDLVLSGFSMDPAFTRALDKGSDRFINRNAVTDLAGSPRKGPELLAKYVDMLLKKGPKDNQPEDLEETLNNVMDIFKYMEDKDVFQKFYSNMLARRLVNGLSISDDTEVSMISRLKGACGFEYTTKLQRMFQDVGSSRDLNIKFSEYLSENPTSQSLLKGVDFSIMVLSSNAWPFQAQTAFVIPPELAHCFEVFTNFYQKQHNGRKLSWCYHLSRGDVVTHYTKSRYTFQVSTYQMAVLMLFNKDLVNTVSLIQSQTGIEMSTLVQVLHILLRARVLKLFDPNNPKDERRTSKTADATAVATTVAKRSVDEDASDTVLAPETQLRLYTDYNNKRFRVNLNMPVKTEAKQETEQTLVNVESDRKVIVQACIVRIMKTRKVMPHNQLINEVITQLSSRFKPTIPLIKHSLNSLIEREYIKRDLNNRETYEYIA
ncbi:Cullin-1 [Sparganum proliferum]